MKNLKTVRWIILCGLTFVLVTLWVPAAALGQIALPSLAPIINIPNEVKQVEEVETSTVRLNNVPLFEIVEPPQLKHNQKEGKAPIGRVQQLEHNLKRLVEPDPNPIRRQKNSSVTNFDPKTLNTQLSTLNGETVLLAYDLYHAQPLKLLTVTQLDAEYYGVSVQQLAQEWQQLLQTHLKQELEDRQPRALQSRAVESFGIVVLAGICSAIGYLMQRFLMSHYQVLHARRIADANIQAETFPDISDPDRTFSNIQQQRIIVTLHHLFGLEERLTSNGFLQWLLTWFQAILWILVSVYICWNFPGTREYTQYVLGVPITLLFIWFLTGFVNRMGDILVNRLMKNWGNNYLFASDSLQRRSLRLTTTLRAIKGLKTCLVIVIGIALALIMLGIPVSSLLAGGAVFAVTLSFGFQNIMRDLVMGCLILWEDQFAIGDYIVVDTDKGFVENMNLRATQIRNPDGGLITLHNSSISQVKNLTRLWSRVDFSIEVTYDSDIQKALSVLSEIGQQLYEDSKWHNCIAEPPEVLGIENISQTGIALRMFIKTQPHQQWVVARELRLRVKLAFDEHHICMEIPQKVFWSADESVSVNSSSDKTESKCQIPKKKEVSERKFRSKRKYLNSQNKQDMIAN
jgi:moderate conductance mechanosensitive channel